MVEKLIMKGCNTPFHKFLDPPINLIPYSTLEVESLSQLDKAQNMDNFVKTSNQISLMVWQYTFRVNCIIIDTRK